MRKLKNEDEIMKMKAAKGIELGKQVEGKMKNASLPENNRNKSRQDETDRSENKMESIIDRLRAEMIDTKLSSYNGLERQIKAIPIKAVKRTNHNRTKSEKK